MTPKADLLKTTREQEAKLQLIYKYNPSLRNLEENIGVLQSLGLDDGAITEVIWKGSTTITKSIRNPLTGEEIAIFIEAVSVKEDEVGQYGVFIGAVPYREFFTTAQLTKEKLETLSQDNPEVRAIYEENQKLKSLLASLHKRA